MAKLALFAGFCIGATYVIFSVLIFFGKKLGVKKKKDNKPNQNQQQS